MFLQRLKTLRENRICQKVNLNVNKERAAHPPGHHLFNNQIFSSKNPAYKM